jgi:peptidyl-prolyl cis-trans isomerase D
MLQKIRDRVQGWIASVILLLLIVPFAFWGINYYFDSGGDVVVVSIDDRDVPLRDYQRTLQNLRQRWIAATEGKVPADEELLKRQTLDSLVNRELLSGAADNLGLRISDAQIRGAIERVDAFHGANGFDRVVYESALGQMGLTPTGFETQVRDDLTAEQLQSAIVGTVFAAGDEVRQLAALRRQTRDIRYAVLSSDAEKESVQPSDDEIHAHYDAHRDEFMEPEQIRAAWLHVTLQSLADEVAVDDGALESWYEDNKANYTVAEQREVRQILAPLPEDADPAHVEQARARAEALAQRIRSGEKMTDIVTAEDGTAQQPLEYSEFGFLGRGMLDTGIEDAVFAAAAGQLVGPLRSRFGFHVLEIGQIKSSAASSFAEVRADVERDFRHAEAAKAWAELTDRLATLAYEHPDGLDAAAEELGLEIRESALFTRADPPPGVLSRPQVLEAAFSEEVLVNRNNSELIELEGDEAVVVRVTEHVPAKAIPLERVRDRIVTRLRFERAREALEKRGATLLGELRGGLDPDSLATREGIEWQAANGVQRDDPGVNRAVLRAAFGAGHPAAGSPVFAGVSLGSGDYALVIVTGVTEPAPESFTKQDLDAVRDELAKLKAGDGWARYVRELRRRADVTIREDLL